MACEHNRLVTCPTCLDIAWRRQDSAYWLLDKYGKWQRAGRPVTLTEYLEGRVQAAYDAGYLNGLSPSR